MCPKCFLYSTLRNYNIIQKYFEINSFSSLSAAENLLHLLWWLRIENHFPIEGQVTYFFQITLRLFFTLLDFSSHLDESFADNLGWPCRLLEKLLIQIRQKRGPRIEPCGTLAMILAIDELYLLSTTHCFLSFRKLT